MVFGRATCGDCGVEFTGEVQGHWDVCEARMCQCCEKQFPCVIEENKHGERVCVSCQRDLEEVDSAYNSDENNDDMEGGD